MKQLVIFSILLVMAGNLFAQGDLIIEGKSSIKLQPEQMRFSVNISVKDKNYAECANQAIEQIQKIKAEFKKNGIDTELIKTQNYSIVEIRKHDYKTKENVFEGFQANIPITIVTTRNNDKNDKIYEIIKNNFKANFNLNFSLTPEQIDAVKEKLIALAIKDANQKAAVIAKNATIRLGKVSKIQYGEPFRIGSYNNNNDFMLTGKMMAMAPESSISETMNPDEVEMRTNITIAWKIEE